jgi:hypothetical protein
VPEDYPGPVAADYPELLKIIEEKVRPERRKLSLKSDASAKGYAKFWWLYGRRAVKLYATIEGMERVLTRSRVSNINSIAFVPSGIVCSEQTVVFSSDKNGFFTLLQSSFHTEWLTYYSSSMRTDVRYTPSDCFRFPRI